MNIEQPPSERARVADLLLELGKKAFDPALAEAERAAAESAFSGLIEKTGTWSLVRSLNALARADGGVEVPAWLRPRLMHVLTLAPLRPDGVRAVLEFIFAVHPSSVEAPRDQKQPESEAEAQARKRGANITTEALKVAAQLLGVPPRTVSAEDWFVGIGPQLLAMLDGEQEQELVKVASYIICSGFLAKKHLGAPGAPAWKTFVDPILQAVDPSLRATLPDDNEAVIDLSVDRVLVPSKALAKALRRLMCLILSSPYPSQCRRIIGPILLPLWCLASWQSPTQASKDDVCVPARSLLETFLRISSTHEILIKLTHNLSWNGASLSDGTAWRYQISAEGTIQAVRPRQYDAGDLDLSALGSLPHHGEVLADILVTCCTKDDLSAFFLSVFKKWLSTQQPRQPATVQIKVEDDPPDATTTLTETVMLQALMEKAPERLVSQFDHLLDLICEVLQADAAQEQADEVVAVTLSLLNLVITAPTFKRAQLKPDVLSLLETCLQRLGRSNRDEIAPTARNLEMLLRYRDEVDQSQDAPTRLTDRQAEDRKTYRLAMSYIAEKDSPPPVRSEGLNLISGLITSGSPALDISAVLVLLSSLIKDEEDYLNLRVIKVFTQLADKHPRSVVDELLDRYTDAKEMLPTDTRLRFGEALLQVVERLGETFAGEVAQRTTGALLAIAGRRGYRPKTMAKQERMARARDLKNKEAEEAWDGEVLDLGDYLPEEERVRHEILTQIVEGWGSKRGTEDVRVRASALSVFSRALETNLAGVGPSAVSAGVDLCINVLTLEPEPEKAILRRASIIVMLGFVRGLDKARKEGRRLGFGLTEASRADMARALAYVAGTDNDGLVREHAADVAESLENWELSRLVPVEEDGRMPPVLAGLQLGLGLGGGGAVVGATAGHGVRPKIEEVE